MLAERGRQHQARVSDQMFIIEDHIEAVEAVRRSHLKGALQFGQNAALATIILPAQRALFADHHTPNTQKRWIQA